jgi:hypothetical protein
VQFQRSEEDESHKPNELAVPKEGGVLFTDDAFPPNIVVDTSHTFAMAHLEAFGTLPGEMKKMLDSTKRKLEVMDDHAAKIDHCRAKKIKMGISSADLTQIFLSYLETFGQPDFRETISLARIEESLIQITPFLSAIIEGEDDAPLFSTTLVAWLDYRRILHSVHTFHTTPLLPSLILSPFTIKIKNSRLLTELRKARINYLSSTETGELRVYEVLVDGFVALQRTVGERKEVGNRVEAGLRRLEGALVGLGEELGKGAGRWVASGIE